MGALPVTTVSMTSAISGEIGISLGPHEVNLPALESKKFVTISEIEDLATIEDLTISKTVLRCWQPTGNEYIRDEEVGDGDGEETEFEFVLVKGKCEKHSFTGYAHVTYATVNNVPYMFWDDGEGVIRAKVGVLAIFPLGVMISIKEYLDTAKTLVECLNNVVNVGDGTSIGTINYETGEVSIKTAIAPADSTHVKCSYALPTE